MWFVQIIKGVRAKHEVLQTGQEKPSEEAKWASFLILSQTGDPPQPREVKPKLFITLNMSKLLHKHVKFNIKPSENQVRIKQNKWDENQIHSIQQHKIKFLTWKVKEMCW